LHLKKKWVWTIQSKNRKGGLENDHGEYSVCAGGSDVHSCRGDDDSAIVEGVTPQNVKLALAVFLMTLILLFWWVKS